MLGRERRGIGTLGRALGALFAALFFLLPSLSAAQQITFTSATASWRNAQDNVPGSQPGDPVITNGVPTSSVSWGGSFPQSGYDVSITIPDPQMFPVADFAHRNFTVPDPSLTSVELDFVLDFEVDGAQTGPLTFTFTFTHEETPNNLDPCPYPTPPGEGCTDRVTFLDAPDPTIFTVGGKTYTLGLSFLDGNGDPVDEFITREGGTINTADLDVDFELVPPVLEVAKSGPATMTVGQSGDFTIDVRNTGPNDAWNATIRDVLPDGATGGMCDATPQVLSAQVFASDGVTPVPGKGTLQAGTDFDLAYAGAPACELTLTMLSAASVVGEDERLILTYRTQVDADTQGGIALTNVAGATEWFDDEPSNLDRGIYARALSDGTVGVVDHEDAHTLTTDLPDYLFEKTVVDPTSGAPLTTAVPGDTLRYRLRLENRMPGPLAGVGFTDEIDRLNGLPLFEAGSLALVTVPAGADTSGTDPNGGAAGTGFLDVRDFSVAAGDSVVVEFDVTLVATIPNGTLATDQAELLFAGVSFGLSDDPNINPPADPFVVGDEDPTIVPIVSAPDFRVEKISTDLTGDPNLLLAGEVLRYTITVQNIGNDDASDARILDAIPVNTTYVSGSTTLNGVAVVDAAGGSSPLASGLAIYSPDDPTPGVLLAGGTAPGRVATLTFDVLVDPAAADGTIISNQGFVSAVAGGVVDQPSDDPGTALPDDPTLDVVGNVPLLFAPKSAALLVDAGTAGAVDPGDVLRYTIDVYNNGAAVATEVMLQDAVPANTTYVADTLQLNGLPVGQPDGGVSPLVGGIAISSSDLTPPVPAPGAGQISIGERATVTFDLLVDAGVPGGTLITNQAQVSTAESPNVLTDGDGDASTGPEPTVVVVGDGQQLAITKEVSVVGGGAALNTSQLEYVVRVTNIGTVPASDVVLTDDLDQPVGGQLSYVAGSGTLNGATTGVTFLGSVLTADYSTANGPLAPGGQVVLRFRADLDPGLAIGTPVTNTAMVRWNAATQNASASVTIAIGGMPGVGAVNGSLWHDRDFDRLRGATEIVLDGWSIDLERNGTTVQSTVSDANGDYQITGIAPNDLNGDTYALRFRAPDAGARTAALGRTESPYTDGLQLVTDLIVTPGSNVLAIDLPIDPNGVVYDAVIRTPAAGSTLTMLSLPGRTPISANCFGDPAQQGQVAGSRGYYKFEFDPTFSDASCPAIGGDYEIDVVPPGSDFVAGASTIIPPQSNPTTPFDVPACPGVAGIDAIPATAQHCEILDSEMAPPITVPAGTSGTNYQRHVTFGASASPGSSQLFNNHIPIDPVLGGAVAISKTTPAINVSRGELVPYEIVFTNSLPAALDLTLVDRFPAGFRYVDDSARVDGVEMEPTQNGNELSWDFPNVEASSTRTVVLLLAVGAGVTEGEFINRAQVVSNVTNGAVSGEASATVRVVPDATFDCTDVLGKVFDDANRNGVQDENESGLAGVRLMTVRGLAVNTDPHGRFHITCAIVPNERRGSNFVLKLDDRSLPTGYRMTTRQTQVARATRGKALRLEFGAAINRVVGLDLADAVFEPGTSEMRAHWHKRIPVLLEELEKSEAILRLSYLADLEAAGLVGKRLEAVERMIRDAWKERGHRPLEVETEIYWRRGAAPDSMPERPEKSGDETSALDSRLPHVGAGPPGLSPDSGQSGERHFSTDDEPTLWAVDPEILDSEVEDQLEEREVAAEIVDTIKLTDVVPPIRFASGVADIPSDVIATLSGRLEDMQHLTNVRLHLVGHADDEALSPQLRQRFRDNEGLSRERAGEVAEFLQAALSLPPESISFAWAGDTQPIAPNTTPQGRALNRRVEVEIWYDEARAASALEEVVVPQEIKRYKVCRTETVCKLRYREGNERRARVKNLIRPLNYDEELIDLPDRFLRQIQETLVNLDDKENVTVKVIAHTDDVPLTGRAERIYGNHVAISKARARRVGLQLMDALGLERAAVASDGRGSSRPVASNATPRGRALNRRIEIEFWHDDPLLELSDELQICPDPAGAETVTRVHEPTGGRLEPLLVEDGEALIPAGLPERIRQALDEVAERTNARLRFVGYTRNERLTRRMAEVYGDDIGLSAARARRTMERIQTQLELDERQVEHEGRGFVHADDVVNGGFIQGDTDHVRIEVVYDELAVLDDYDGIEITRITRELEPQEPLSLNLMRITVDGVPIDDPARSSADIQRCTDVALEETDIAFRFDDLVAERRLSLTSSPITTSGDPVRFRMYTNYPHSIERAEVRIFEAGQSLRDEPLGIAEIDRRGFAQWTPDRVANESPQEPLAIVLRAYGENGLWDETAAQSLWLVPGDAPADKTLDDAVDDFATESITSHDDALLAGYGESEATAHNIPLESSGSVRVSGSGIPANHTVWLAGTELPVDGEGNFVGEVLLPSGLHTVEVAVLDDEGNGELFLRDLELERDDWFFVGLADLTLSVDLSGDSPDALDGNNATDLDALADGRLAFFANGKFGRDWKLTASADTREGPVEDLFTNFLDKSPDALFRRLDPDYHYPTFGDDSTIDETAPTLGKFYVKLEKGDDHLMWGNFTVRYSDNELALVERGLYGANLLTQSTATTSFGERRYALDGFAADPGTVPSREEFRGTGGSVYFLNRQDLLIGSERLRIEIRDKATGLVSEVVRLQPELDYDIDYFQGRVLLSEPLSAIVDDRLLVRSDGESGNEAWLVVQYEYTPGFDEVDTLNVGGRGHVWLTDFMKLGVTASRSEDSGDDTSLYAADLTLRSSARSWIKVQAGRSEGRVSTTLRSDDGGFGFVQPLDAALLVDDAYGYRADLSVDMAEWWDVLRGRVTLYGQRLEAGYSAPGLNTLTDTDQFGGTLELPITEDIEVNAKADHTAQDDGLETTAAEVDVRVRVAPAWEIQAGARHDRREDDFPTVIATQKEGDRTDAVVQLQFDPGPRSRTYAFGQATLHSTGDRDENHRGGIGGAYRVTERISVDGEVSHGTLGPAATVGTAYQYSERTKLYMNYSLDNERGYDGLHEQRGSLTTGAKARLSDSTSVYAENQYQHASVTGLTHSFGIDYAPTERWNFGVNWEDGETRDRQTSAETTRRAGGLRAGYRFEDLSVSGGFEYIFNDTENPDGTHSERTTWLLRSNLKYQMNEDGRLLAKFNHAISDSSEGDVFDGGFTEAILGYAYRPIAHDRFDALVKYTYFYNVPTSDQIGQDNTPAQFIQKSHIAAIDLSYDLTPRWTIGGKYAYRLSQVSVDRDDPDFFDNNAHLYIVRTDWRFLTNWETTVEGRMLYLPDIDERRAGALASIYRYFGDNFKAGIGYNFTDFSEDLTDLSYDHHGLFFNVIGSF